jgi:hypothetical protein
VLVGAWWLNTLSGTRGGARVIGGVRALVTIRAVVTVIVCRSAFAIAMRRLGMTGLGAGWADMIRFSPTTFGATGFGTA